MRRWTDPGTHTGATRADLDAADRAFSQQWDLRLGLSILYLSAQLPEQSVHQLDTGMPAHGAGAKLPSRAESALLEPRGLEPRAAQ